jgi:2'-5' RNA ligase
MSRGESTRARVFFALWPDEDTREALAAWSHAAHALCGGRAIPAQRIHLTLFFVGAVERSRIEALESAAGAVRAEPFDITFDTVGYWRHNHIVWAGASRCPPALPAVAASLSAILAAHGYPPEERAYVPHVTLVRNAERKPAPAAVAPAVWRVREFVLAESVPAPGGVRYEVRRRWPLTAHNGRKGDRR